LAQAKKHNEPTNPMPAYMVRALKEGAFLLLAFIAIYGLISLFTYNRMDQSFTFSGDGTGMIHNTGGAAGAWLADFFMFAFGYMA
jgi:S-DNA-T family DNA segregation ATPase FtsK/SpoIIIE